MLPGRCLTHARAVSLYACVAIALAWPLPAHLSTHLTGPLDSDTAVYVWNQWVFHHELVENRSIPYFTGKIFSLTPKANLSLHNYTTFANLLALPLIPSVGVVAAFNIVFLLLTALTAYAMFLLAMDLTRGAGAESWLAGLVFAWSPVLVTRGAGHFSLVAAAPLPIFLMLLLRATGAWSLRDGALLGLVMAWAASTDAYYGVFCLMLASVVLTTSVVRVRRAQETVRTAAITRSLDILIVLLAGLVVAILVSRGWTMTFMARPVSVRSLYNPTLALTLLVLARVAVRFRPVPVGLDAAWLWRLARMGAITGIVCAAVLSPVLYAVGRRIAEGRWYGSSSTFWRSSPPGIDAMALLLPNPNHPFAPHALRDWLAARPNGYLENVGSVPLIAIALIAWAWWRGWRAPRAVVAVAALFALLALGPFITVAGANTYVPGPWALLRYVPIIGLARSPARFTVILTLAVAALLAVALRWLTMERPAARRVILAGTAVLLLLELFPAPRVLYAAAVPRLYERIAADPDPEVRVLELPFGVRDGTRSVGNFTARSQFFQTFHRKPLIGGYLSRVSRRRVDEIRKLPILDALITLSEGTPLAPGRLRELEARAPAFVERARLGYVVIDRGRATPELVAFAQRLFRLELQGREGALELYLPRRAN